MDTRSPGHTTELAPVQPRTSAPDATDGRDGVAGGRGAPEWQTRGRRGLSGPSGRRPRPPGTCSAAPSLPSRKGEWGCFLKDKKNLLPLNLRHFPRARKRAWGAGAPHSLSDAPRRAPALRPEHAHTPPSCVLRPSGANPKLARPRQVSRPVRLRPKAASKSRPAPAPRRPLPAPPAPKPPLPRSPGEVSVLARVSLLSHGPQNASPRVDGVPQAPRPPPPGREAARRLPAEERGVFGRPNARFLQDVSRCCPERSAFPFGAQRRRGSGHTTPTWSWGRVEGWHVRAPPCSAHRRGGPVLSPQGHQTHVPGPRRELGDRRLVLLTDPRPPEPRASPPDVGASVSYTAVPSSAPNDTDA